MFENGCFLRRQKRFKCPRKEMMRRNSRSSTTTSSSHVDGTPSGGDQTAERQLPSGHSASSIKRGGDADDFRKPVTDDIKPAPERLFPLPEAGPADGRNVSLLEAIASVDYTRACNGVFPLSYSSGDVTHAQGLSGGLMPQPHRFDDRHSGYPFHSNLAVLQYQPQQPHLGVSTSLVGGYSKPLAGPEVLTSTTAFPVYDALQRYRRGSVQQLGIDGTTHGLGDQLQAALSYRSSSRQFSEVYRQLQQPSYQRHHPALDGDPVPTVGVIPPDYSALSFSPYHSVQARFDGDQRQSFRPSSTSGSGQRPCSYELLVPRFSPAVANATGNVQHQNLISSASAEAVTVDSYHSLSDHVV